MADPLAAAAFDDVPSEESEESEVSDQESSEEELDSEEEAAQKKVRPSFRSASGSSRRAAMPEPGQGWARATLRARLGSGDWTYHSEPT